MSTKSSTKRSISNGKSPKRRLKPVSQLLASTTTEAVGGGGNTPVEKASKPAFDQYLALLDAIGARQPTDLEIGELSRFIIANPEIWFLADAENNMASLLITKTFEGVQKALLSARAEIIEKQLGGEDSHPLERLVIKQVTFAWVRLQWAEAMYNSNVVGNSTTSRLIMHWDQFLANAQRRHLVAIEALARIRRLGRIGPAVQFNIAESGSQQMNVLGDRAEAAK